MKGVSDAIELLIDVTGAWLKSGIRPISVLNEMLPRFKDERQIPEATKTWLPSILVSIIVSFPVLNSYGIKWDNLGFHLFSWLVTLTNIVIDAFLFHGLLICFKLKSEFVRTFVITVTPSMAYLPIFSLAATPELVRWLDALQVAKSAKQPFITSMEHYYAAVRSEEPNVIILLVDNVSVVLAFLCFVLSAEAAAQWYNNDRLKTYLAGTLAVSLGIVLAVGMAVIQLWALFAFMSAN